MTEDCKAEKQALAQVWLCCIFHVLQAFWRNLWKREFVVAKEDRPYLLSSLMRKNEYYNYLTFKSCDVVCKFINNCILAAGWYKEP